MKLVTYGGQSFLTSDSAAEALLEFAAATASNVRAEVVEIPAVSLEGEPTLASFVVGPASEIIVFPAEVPWSEPATGEVENSLRDRTQRFISRADGSYLAEPNEWLHIDPDEF